MTYPKDIKIIDTMLGIPTHVDRSDWYSSFRPLLNDQQSRDMFKMPAQYMFKDIP
jgi:poly(A) polymerase Pap1